jgi:hypothetical protein
MTISDPTTECDDAITERQSDAKCPHTDIGLIAHSLASEVVGDALVNLDTSSAMQANNSSINNSKLVKSVDTGRNSNTNMIAREFPLGYAIECIVDIFYNLYNREDDELYFNQ